MNWLFTKAKQAFWIVLWVSEATIIFLILYSVALWMFMPGARL